MWLTLASIPLLNVILLPLLWHHAGISERAELRLSQLTTYLLPLSGLILVLSSLLAGEITNFLQAGIAAGFIGLAFSKLRSASDEERRAGKIAQITLAGIGIFLAPIILDTLNSLSGMVTLLILVSMFLALASYYPKLLMIGREEDSGDPTYSSTEYPLPSGSPVTGSEYPLPEEPGSSEFPLPTPAPYGQSSPNPSLPPLPTATPPNNPSSLTPSPQPNKEQEEQEKPVPGQPSSRTRRGGSRENRPVFKPKD